MATKENDITVDQTVYTKIRALLGYLATDIKHDWIQSMVRLLYHIHLFYDSFIYLNRTGKQLKMTPEKDDHLNEKEFETVRGLISQDGRYG